jgi:poly(A) polymerase
MLLLDLLPQPCSLSLALGALLHDVAKPATFDDSGDRIRFHGHDALGAKMSAKILRRLKFPAKVVQRVESLVLDHLKFFNVRKMKTSTLKRFLRGSHIDELLELHRIDCLAGSGDLSNYQYTLARLTEFNQGAAEQGLRPDLPIDGKDLLEMGLEAGPQIGEILRALEDEILEGRVAGREQALDFARGRAGL